MKINLWCKHEYDIIVLVCQYDLGLNSFLYDLIYNLEKVMFYDIFICHVLDFT